MARALVLALLAVVVTVGPAAAARPKLQKNNLLTLVTPTPSAKAPASAHPHVNVVILFGRLADGTPADPASFRARLGREDVTSLFHPTTTTSGQQTGVRARLDPSSVKLGTRPRNLLRLSIQALRRGKGPRAKDKDRVRFGAKETPNQPCTAQADADTPVIVPGVEVAFTGSTATLDPDQDELTYLWNFGDGTTSTEPNPQKSFESQEGELTVTLTASDGQATCSDTVVLEAVPALDAGKTPGILRVEAAAGLEFGGVAIGSPTTRTLTLRNLDDVETSQVRVRLGSTHPAFTLSDPLVTLGPAEVRDLTLTFTPQAGGHAHTRVSLVANVQNRKAASAIAHGFGGEAPGSGPTLAAAPFFYTDISLALLGIGTYGVMPDGRRFFADNGVNTCVVPGNGIGTGDFCLTDQDCAVNGGTCALTATCPGGDNPGQPCTLPSHCPGSFCPAYTLFDPVDWCGDGESLFLISDEGTFTEPDPAAETERAVTIMRIDLDANGNVLGKKILDRATTETTRLACDGFPAGQGGQIYIPEFRNVPDMGTCFRSEREALVRLTKGSGATQVLMSRMDAAIGLLECDDLDPVTQLEITPNGSRMLAAFESGGLWQIRPTPVFFSPDITEFFQIHPDGSVLFAASGDSGGTGLIKLYRLTAAQVQTGPLSLSALVPCATLTIPNNGGRTVAIGFAAASSTPGSQEATALVSFVAATGGLPDNPLAPSLLVKGTAAFSAPPDTTTCSAVGLINLDALELAF